MQSLDTFDPIERFTGTGLLDEYEFDFLITDDSQLLVVVLDDDDEEVERFRGDDADPFMDSLEFDETDGGGTITLTDPLPTDYTLVLLLAPDEPVQDSNFTAAGVFSLSYLQAALNKLGSFIQRASWVSNRSIRLHDAFNDTFDLQLPFELEADRTIAISTDGLSLALGPTITELLQATTDAADAAASEAAAEAAQVAAENAQIAAEAAQVDAEAAQLAAEAAALGAGGFTGLGPQTVNQNASTALTGETTASGTYTQVDYWMRIVRGTTVFGRAEFSIFFRNGAWELVSGADRYAVTALGVTFTVHATTGQITAVVDNGAGNATITGKKLPWAA